MLLIIVYLGVPLLYFWVKVFKNPNEFSDEERGIIIVFSILFLMLLLVSLISWIERYKTAQPW